MKLMDDKNRAANFAALFAYVLLNYDDVHPDNITGRLRGYLPSPSTVARYASNPGQAPRL